MSPDEAASLVKDDMALGICASDQIGAPKAFLNALAARLRNETLNLRLFSSAGIPESAESLLAVSKGRGRKYGQMSKAVLRDAVNQGRADYVDLRTSAMPYHTRQGRYGKLDLAVLEAMCITSQGHIIPSLACGDGPSFVAAAEAVIVEVNSRLPEELEGIHDVYLPGFPPNREAIPIRHPDDRIGLPYILACLDKVIAVVESDMCDNPGPATEADDDSKAIANRLIDFLKEEVGRGRLPKALLPLQVGIGRIPGAVASCLAQSSFAHVDVYSGAVGDGVMDMIDSGKTRTVSSGALYFSDQGLKRFFSDISRFKRHFVLRPFEVSNSPEVIARLGVIALNSALEVDIYGNANATHVLGSRSVAGVAGSPDFLWNGHLTFLLMSSTSAGRRVSSIVPMVPHVDHPEHAIDVVITEQGVADLRGLAPTERALRLIQNCSHPDYRPMLKEYLQQSTRASRSHQPHMLDSVFSFHQRLARSGDMRK